MDFQSHSDSFPTKIHRLSRTHTHFSLSVHGIPEYALNWFPTLPILEDGQSP